MNACLPESEPLGVPPEMELDETNISDNKEDDGRKIITATILATIIRYALSMGLLIFSILLVMSSILQNQTVSTVDMGLHPGVVVVLFWLLLIYLGMLDGSQGCFVGLQPLQSETYHIYTIKKDWNNSLSVVNSWSF